MCVFYFPPWLASDSLIVSLYSCSMLQIPLKLGRQILLEPAKPIVLKVVPRDEMITEAWMSSGVLPCTSGKLCLGPLESLIYPKDKTQMKMKVNLLALIDDWGFSPSTEFSQCHRVSCIGSVRRMTQIDREIHLPRSLWGYLQQYLVSLINFLWAFMRITICL